MNKSQNHNNPGESTESSLLGTNTKSENPSSASFMAEKNHRIVVSGIGMISAAGGDVNANFANMLSGTRFPSTKPSIFSSEIEKSVFECDSASLDKSLLPYRRTFALCVVALQEALADAGLQPEDLRNMKVGVSIGTTVACTLNDLDFYAKVKAGKSPDILPLKRYFCGDISLEVANLLQLRGRTALSPSLPTREEFSTSGVSDGMESDASAPSFVPTLSVTNACASGTNAISIGYSWIQSGECDIVIAGGADELNLIPYCGFNSLQVMSNEPCLPFDNRREGLSLGEGAGILILERGSVAEERGIVSAVELTACGGGSDAYHITGPHPEGKGLKTALSQALNMADMQASDIDYINAHGTATQNNDQVESAVFADFFGHDIKFSSTKFFTGHTLAAAGAIEAAVCVKGIREGKFPGMTDLIPGEDIAVSPSLTEIPYKGGGVISTSMAFGGSCAALLFARSEFFSKDQGSDTRLSTVAHSQKISSKQPVLLNLHSVEESLKKVLPLLAPHKINTAYALNCVSTGIIGPFGRGKNAFKDAVYGNFEIEKNRSADKMQMAMIPEEVFRDPKLKRMRRRADRLSLAMYCAAMEAVESATDSSGMDWQDGKTTALIVVTSLGAYKTTFRFLDTLLDFGQSAPSPTLFSNSVHNAPAFYITSGLNIRGSSTTVTGFNHPFQQALKLSEHLLAFKECDQVLLVAGDEVCEEMIDMSGLWFAEYADNIPNMWGEGAVAFLLDLPAEGADVSLVQSADSATSVLTEKIFGKTLINDAFVMAAEMI